MDYRDYDYEETRKGFNEGTMTFTVMVENDDGEEVAHVLPARFDVCPTCDGRGSHVNPSIDAHGITPEEFAEDPDFEEAYFAGAYDVPCAQCSGKRVVGVVDVERLTDAQKPIHAAHEAQVAEDFYYQRADAYTRRMENGGYD